MWWILLACQEPFDEDRHDLTDFRIVGMRMDEAPEALLWAPSGLWASPLPTLTWAEATSGDSTTWSLTAEDADGHTEAGELTYSGSPTNPNLLAFTRSDVDTGFQLALELDAEIVTHFSAPAGTFAETGPNTTDFDPGDSTGVLPVVALSFDGVGGNRWDIIDLPVDVAPPWLAVGTRLFPTELTEGGEGWWAVTVEADDGWAGLRLVDAAPAAGPEEGAALCGASGSVGFDPVVLAQGTCDRDSLVGERLVMWATGELP